MVEVGIERVVEEMVVYVDLKLVDIVVYVGGVYRLIF